MSLCDWNLIVCGINHKTSGIDDRAPLQLGHDELPEANNVFANLTGVLESAVVSTCNRVEFYFVGLRDHEAFEIVKAFYNGFRGLDVSGLKDKFYCRKNRHVADHLFRVAAGIDSMVLGEDQIFSQIKEAYSSACSVKSAGKVIHRVFHQAFRVGKQVRSDTSMGKGACSVSSAAMELLKTNLREIEKPRILFVGINQMIALAAANLSRQDNFKFQFANRTPQKAEEFASKFHARGYSLSELPDLLPDSDAVISCTGSQRPVISREMIGDAFGGNNHHPMIFVDMAVPRDIELEAGEVPGITVYNLDDIKDFVERQEQERKQAIPQAEEIIERRLGEFVYWFNHVCHEPIYNGLKDAFENIRRQELEPIIDKLNPQARREINQATKTMVNRLLQLKIRTSPQTKSKGE